MPLNPYLLTLLAFALAVVVQCVATGVATHAALCPPYRRAFMVVAIGLALLALHHSFTLELALSTGLFDLRQALLAAGVSLLLLFGVLGLRPKASETPPPR